MIPTTQVSPETLELVPALLLGSRLWSAGGSIDEGELGALRAALLRTQHRRQLAAIPAYARLAAELSIDDDGLDPDGEVFLLSDDWLKGYDPAWADNELPALTEWLAEVSTVRPRHPADVADLGSWRAALRRQEVYVTVSSGTRGTRSLVPRDRMTLVALRSSSGVRLPWSLPPGQYGALLLTPRGMGSGIQSGAMGLGRAARHAAHLDDPLALDLLRQSATEDLPVVVYGSPARLVDLLAQVGRRSAAADRKLCGDRRRLEGPVRWGRRGAAGQCVDHLRPGPGSLRRHLLHRRAQHRVRHLSRRSLSRPAGGRGAGAGRRVASDPNGGRWSTRGARSPGHLLPRPVDHLRRRPPRPRPLPLRTGRADPARRHPSDWPVRPSAAAASPGRVRDHGRRARKSLLRAGHGLRHTGGRPRRAQEAGLAPGARGP